MGGQDFSFGGVRQGVSVACAREIRGREEEQVKKNCCGHCVHFMVVKIHTF